MSRLEIDSQPFPADRQGHQKMAVVLCDVYGKSWPR